MKGPEFPDVDTFSADLPAADISDAGSLPDASMDISSGSVDMPSVDLAGKAPDVPFVGGGVSGDLPSAGVGASGSLPSADVDVSVPSGSVDMPSADVKKPKKGLFGGRLFGAGKGKMGLEVSDGRL